MESHRGGYGAQGGATAAGALREHTIEKVRCRGGGAQKKGAAKFLPPRVSTHNVLLFFGKGEGTLRGVLIQGRRKTQPTETRRS